MYCYRPVGSKSKVGGPNFSFQSESTIFQIFKVKVKKKNFEKGGGVYVNIVIVWQF